MKSFTEKITTDLDNLEIEPEVIKDEIEIIEIIDIFNDPKDLPQTNEGGVFGIDTDLSNKELKRGDTIYITAMIKKKGQSFTSPATQSVLKVRIVDIYNGLSYLNKVINK